MLSKILKLFIFIVPMLISVWGECSGARHYDYIAQQEALRLFSQAEAMANVGKYESTIIQLNKLLDYYPGIYLTVDALLLRGDCYKALGRLKLAEADYKRYIKKSKDKLKGYLRLVECYGQMKDFKSLTKIAIKATKLSPLSDEVQQMVDYVNHLVKKYPQSKRLAKLHFKLTRIIEFKKRK